MVVGMIWQGVAARGFGVAVEGVVEGMGDWGVEGRVGGWSVGCGGR